jgi:quercetin dioxygenase-like cupin family protein
MSLAVAMTAASAAAQLAVHLDPSHPIVFETEALRVLNVTIAADQTSLEHVHANDLATICISGCEVRARLLGAGWGSWLSRQPGQVLLTEYAGRSSAHTEQAGKRTYHVISVENLRQRDWSRDLPVSSPVTRPRASSRAFHVSEVRLSAGATDALHTHLHPVVAVLVAGEIVDRERGQNTVKDLRRTGDWTVLSAADPHQLMNRSNAAAYVVEVEVR